jgi:small conductance mechanosensitive channel
MLDLSLYTDRTIEAVINLLPHIVFAAIILLVGLKAIGHVSKMLKGGLESRNVEPSLAQFVYSLFKVILKILLVISVVSALGVPMTPFIALVGAAGLAVGLALQGSLSNFAGGMIILFFKIFKVGDYIEAQSQTGTVRKIEIFHTTLLTPDNKTIIIPNGILSNGVITNFSKQKVRRVDLVFSVSYGDDLKKAKKAIDKVIESHSKILKEPAPLARVAQFADSSVNFNVRVWVNKEDYWDVYYDLLEQVKEGFDKAGITIPYPQTDVYVHKA